MFQRILLPIDGSDLSLRAVDTGIALAKAIGAKVFALHVVEPLASVAYFTEKLMASQEAYTRGAMRRAEGYLDEVKQRAEAAGVACEVAIAEDHRPCMAIVGTATTQGCDLIILGSHGRSGLDRLLLGSETYKTLLSSKVPVMVCR
ncbi:MULTISPECIES: universal stress protein [Dyella]|uniref:Universal stress protein n=2 Tax=Dyella TaxID=231454 RepID=A0A4R0YRJ3_9GAMM|nr:MULTISPECIES: universal stress protein [Dyella]TBR40485.1 universal stress protein [Dyella terrae]TCI11933.1 universal stress protein [Dyella soli]